MLFRTRALSVSLATLPLLVLAACGDGGSSSTARISMDLVDAPVDGAEAVVVRVAGVSLHSETAGVLSYDFCADTPLETADDMSTEEPDAAVDSVVCAEAEVREVNLLALTGGESLGLLDNQNIPAGDYNWVRLALDEQDPGHIELSDGSVHSLSIPSGAQTGLKINGGFTAYAGSLQHFLIDFDLRKSVHLTGNGRYMLRPTLRMLEIENPAVQALSGSWAVADAGECAYPMAYVFAGHNVVPDDIDGGAVDPVVSAEFVADDDGVTLSYETALLGFGNYTVAYTCDGALDDPASDDQLLFVSAENVVVGE